jgi:hypothetical protein
METGLQPMPAWQRAGPKSSYTIFINRVTLMTYIQ